MIDISSPAELQEHILSADVALLDFWAPWCGPCRMLAPVLEALEAATPGLVIGKVDVDQNQSLAKAYGLRAIPTLLLVRKGEVVGTLTGAQTLEKLKKFVGG